MPDGTEPVQEHGERVVRGAACQAYAELVDRVDRVFFGGGALAGLVDVFEQRARYLELVARSSGPPFKRAGPAESRDGAVPPRGGRRRTRRRARPRWRGSRTSDEIRWMTVNAPVSPARLAVGCVGALCVEVARFDVGLRPRGERDGDQMVKAFDPYVRGEK